MKIGYFLQRSKAVRLRKAGLSYSEILKKNPVARSSISLWCRDVDLTAEHKKRIENKSRACSLAGIKAIQTTFWQRRCDAFMQGVDMSQRLGHHNPNFVAGLMLYLAEGTKKSTMAITNSDERIIKFMKSWLGEFFQIKPEQLVMGLQIHPGQDEMKIKKYWSKITHVPMGNFHKTFTKSKGSKYRKNRLENGIVKLVVRNEGSTYLLFKVLGAINGYLNITVNEPINPKNWMSMLPYAKEYKN